MEATSVGLFARSRRRWTLAVLAGVIVGSVFVLPRSSPAGLPPPPPPIEEPEDPKDPKDPKDPEARSPIVFRAAVTYPMPGPNDVTMADLDGDGALDVAVRSLGSVAVLFGRGDGTLEPPKLFPIGPDAERDWCQVLAADVNLDGRLDLVVTVGADDCLAVRLNLGDREFAEPARYPVGRLPNGVVADDFNGDGWPDVAVTNHRSGDFCILLNQGDGSFAPAVSYRCGNLPSRITSGDFNADGRADLAIANYQGGVLVCLGARNGGFFYSPQTGVGSHASQVVSADFNLDRLEDLATAETFGNSVSILTNVGYGIFRADAYPGGTYPHVMDVADFDGDGYPDLAVPNNESGQFVVLWNLGGTLAAPAVFSSAGQDTRRLAAGDLNGDGLPDVVTSNAGSENLSVLLNVTPIPAVASITLQRRAVRGGQTVAGTVRLRSPARRGGAVVRLAGDSNLVVPAAVRIRPGRKVGTFRVGTVQTPKPVRLPITARSGRSEKSAMLLLRP
ncbi:MAG: FG-GAP repeat domain-containing protein [Armatimonadota bacterium]